MSEPSCPGCRERDALIAKLLDRVEQLEQRVRDLEARLNTNSSNSSTPPSANPASAPKPVLKKRTGRKPGGQPGHPAHLRRRVPPGRVQRTVPFVPKRCSQCREPLPAKAGPGDPEPTWHQVAELPATAAVVTEYQGHYRTCPGCGKLNHAPIPNELRASSVGPNLAAFLAYLAGRHHLSKRGLEELVEEVCDVPVALGTVANLEAQMSQALAAPHGEAQQAVRQAPCKNVDETGWKLAGRLCWLWVAATATVAVFLIQARRNWRALQALLGKTVVGFVSSDRFGAYNGLPPWQRQVCWAHLKRDFQKCVDRGGPAARSGKAGLQIVRRVFEEWHLFRGGAITRQGLLDNLEPEAKRFERLLKRGCRCADAKAAVFCANVLDILPAVWRFVAQDGVEPTNNHAERLLRGGVLWRKNAFGCHSGQGCRFVERLLTVVQTLRLQQRPVLPYLRQALIAHRQGLPAPSLLAAS
jgi:transposase